MAIMSATDTETCLCCGATIEEVDGELRHVRTRAKACDLDDDASLTATRR